MKLKFTIIFAITALTFSYSLSAQVPPPPPNSSGSNEVIYVKAERMPVFPGECESIENVSEQAKCSEANIINYVASHTVYPNKALKKGIEGRVFIEFVINQKGDVTDVRILKGVHKTIDKAAIDAVKRLPNLKPAVQDGKRVKVKYTIPINFKL